MAVKRDYITGGRDFSNIANINYDRIRRKDTVKSILLGDSDLLHYLNNQELDEDEPESYFQNNVLDYLYLSPNPYKTTHVQDIVKNFVCYDIDDVSNPYNQARIHNVSMKNQVLTIMCIVHRSDIITTEGYNRLDVLSYIVDDLFAWSNALDMQLEKFSDFFESYDAIYLTRTIKFHLETPNSISVGGRGNSYERLK